jgi:hypothetical protein
MSETGANKWRAHQSTPENMGHHSYMHSRQLPSLHGKYRKKDKEGIARVARWKEKATLVMYTDSPPLKLIKKGAPGQQARFYLPGDLPPPNKSSHTKLLHLPPSFLLSNALLSQNSVSSISQTHFGAPGPSEMKNLPSNFQFLGSWNYGTLNHFPRIERILGMTSIRGYQIYQIHS